MLFFLLFSGISLTRGPGSHLCSEAGWSTHQGRGQSRYTWTQRQQSSGMLLNFSFINMLGAPTQSSWTALGIPANFSKAQLI